MVCFGKKWSLWQRAIASVSASAILLESAVLSVIAAPPRSPDKTVECEVLVVGGGLAGAATAYESLLAGRTVCLTELTDWVGGQISSQGTSALDETTRQRSLLYYSRGYKELRRRIENKYGELNPGECWVSFSCYIPADAHELLFEQLEDAADRGDGTLKWFPATVIKELELSGDGKQIDRAIAIQHKPRPGTPPLNAKPLSQTIEDAYRYANSSQFEKTIIRFSAKPRSDNQPADWYVVEATETGELIALADVPYRLGLDPRTHREPSSPVTTTDPYCTQGFTYTFAMERTEQPQPQEKPSFYDQYAPYYSYELPRLANFDLVFTYRRIWSPRSGEPGSFGPFKWTTPTPGDISMQNWTWGNDYRPGTSKDNLIYSREQLQQTGQLQSGGWLGGLRAETLRRGEENALGYYYWLVQGTTDSQLEDDVKHPNPNHRFLSGFDAPMGTAHGLSKYPYIREGRRIIGRPYFGYEEGFSVTELDISRRDYSKEYYQETLSPRMYRNLWVALAGLKSAEAIVNNTAPEDIMRRTRSTIYPDAVGIAQYPIDFHPCMTLSPPEKPGNTEREGVRIGQGSSFPAQIPLRALIPQKIDNLLVVGKSIATSHTAAAAYRVHSFEWSSGAAAGMTIDFAFDRAIAPYQLVETMPRVTRELRDLQSRLQWSGNPIAFPDTSIFNLDWSQW
ncbi:FAD-dependent oxidoreductase [Lusitaniella coriacea LEGE 07157]|uniref:FAD-dependent oxidoreductase n=1 Tax=Lusitaniella coriacea LEGE 07157 TaxID=945747 RepID=A0A8J7DV27_9CYAN|nr:FAD-dependent oxidoreductase [Lusitaniella coriacea]MBE9115535.1 FAD-dependent oxidoreductase [Lusitaniella coriacea LEGE 07157]